MCCVYFETVWNYFSSKCCILICRFMQKESQRHNDKMTSEDFFNKIYTSHFIVRVRKGLLRVLMWEGVGDRTKTAIYWPHSYGHQRCVFLVLLKLNQRPGGSAFYWVLAFSTTSCQQLLWTPTCSGASRASSAWCGSLPHLVYDSNWSLTVWLLVLTELYNSSTSTQSPTQSLEWHVWLSSNGNNCHAVQRSLSFGASVYECIMAFNLSHFISQIRPRDLFRLLAIGMCHFLPAYHFGKACLAGSKVKIQHK